MPISDSTTSIALAHDWLVARRGGELVLDAITTHLLNTNRRVAHLYTMFDSGTPITPAIDAIPRTTSSLNRLPKPLRRWLLPRYPKAVEELSRKLAAHHQYRPMDLLISTSSAAIKALVPPTTETQSIPHICYCHAPARYLWSQTDQYTTQPGLKSRLRAAGLDHFGDALREWDKRTADTVTQFIANSHFIANQIRTIYERDAVVIHPPVRTDYFTPADHSQSRTNRLLYVGAVEPYKRVDLAIEASLLTDLPIDIVGTGSQLASLQKKHQSSASVRFHGHATDDQVRAYFRTSMALIQPQVEDFGITAVEAQSCGCPVVARRAGGALDSIIESKTGTLFDHPDPKELADAIDKIPDHESTAETCRANALRFSYEAFSTKLDAVIAACLSTR